MTEIKDGASREKPQMQGRIRTAPNQMLEASAGA